MTSISTQTKAPWFSAARVKTLPAAVAPVFVGTMIAYPKIVGWVFAATILATLMIQIGTNFANDYFDYKNGVDNDDRLGPARATAQGWITPEMMKRGFILAFGISFLIGLSLVYRGGLPILLIGLLSILFGILYTGGPKPLGYLGFGDILVFIFFGPVAVAGTVYVHTLAFSPIAVLFGCGVGAVTNAILIVNNKRDIDNDRVSGKMTMVARFGLGFANFEYIAMWVVALLAPIVAAIISGQNILMIGAVGTIIGLPLIFKFTKTEGAKLNPMLGQTAGGLLVYSAVCCLSIFLVSYMAGA